MTHVKNTDISPPSPSVKAQDIEIFLKEVRDLLGFIRVENAVFMDEGALSLTGLYMQKIMMLKDLEEKAAALAERDSSNLIRHGLNLLSEVQKELQTNTAQHIRALSMPQQKGSKNITAGKYQGNQQCH